MKTTEVRFWEVRRRKTATPSWEIRWIVGGKHCSRSRRTKALAESFLADLRAAARRGEAFDMTSGLPDSMLPDSKVTWLAFAQRYVDMKWPRAAAKSRDAMTDALATVSAALVRDPDNAPDPTVMRVALRRYLLPCNARDDNKPNEVAEAAEWLAAHSLLLRNLVKAAHLRRALDAIALTLEGKPAGATTVRR